jgi:hypothetical protein
VTYEFGAREKESNRIVINGAFVKRPWGTPGFADPLTEGPCQLFPTILNVNFSYYIELTQNLKWIRLT